MTNTVKLQIIGQFDHYDFKEPSDSKHKIWLKNLNVIPEEEEEDFTFIEQAFIKQNDAIHLIGSLTYEDKIKCDAEILLNSENEYEIINPVNIYKTKKPSEVW